LKNSSEISSVVKSGSERKVEPNCEESKNSDSKQSSDGKVRNLFAFPKEESSTNYTFKTPEKGKHLVFSISRIFRPLTCKYFA